MVPTFGLMFQAFLIVLGCLWCREIFGRMRNDVQEVREGDATRRGIIIGLWLVTAVIIFLMVSLLLTIIIRAAGAWRWPLF